MWSILQYTEKAKEFAKEYWGLDFNIPIMINPNMTGNAMAKFVYRRTTSEPVRIEISKNTLLKYDDEEIESTLKHELTHWALLVLGKPNDDGHPVFEAELKRIGASSTRVTKYVGELHEAGCSTCGKSVVIRKTKALVMSYINGRKSMGRTIAYTSKCCGASLVYKGMNMAGEFATNEKTIEAPKLTADQVEAAKKKLKAGDIVYLLGRNVNGEVILAGRRMILSFIEGNMAHGCLINDKNGNIQKSVIKMPIECLDMKV